MSITKINWCILWHESPWVTINYKQWNFPVLMLQALHHVDAQSGYIQCCHKNLGYIHDIEDMWKEPNELFLKITLLMVQCSRQVNSSSSNVDTSGNFVPAAGLVSHVCCVMVECKQVKGQRQRPLFWWFDIRIDDLISLKATAYFVYL